MSETKSFYETLCGKITSVDKFGKSSEWLLPGSVSIVSSIPGAFCTILLQTIIFVYAGYRMKALFNRSDYNILTEVQNDFFTEDYKVSRIDGF